MSGTVGARDMTELGMVRRMRTTLRKDVGLIARVCWSDPIDRSLSSQDC
jgi:hypothetical protein